VGCVRVSVAQPFTATYWSKSPRETYPASFNAFAGSDSLQMCWWTLYRQKLESMDYPSLKTASSYIHSFWHNTGVCDGQTDRNTVAKKAFSIAACCINSHTFRSLYSTTLLYEKYCFDCIHYSGDIMNSLAWNKTFVRRFVAMKIERCVLG